jgi:hypothetical protein
MSEPTNKPILDALIGASEPLGDTIDDLTEGRVIGKRHTPNQNDAPEYYTEKPRTRPAQTLEEVRAKIARGEPSGWFEPPSGFHAAEQTPTNALAAKVAATNRANHAIVLLQRYVAQRLAPFIGQKVIKNTGWGTGLTKKVSAHIGEIKCDRPGEHFHISHGGAWISVRLSVSRCYKDERRESSMSYEAYASVGRTEDGILQELIEPPTLRTDYTEAEIRGKRALLRDLEDKVRDAKSALDGFGEFDR